MLSKEKIIEIKTRISFGETYASIAKDMNVTPTAIFNAANNISHQSRGERQLPLPFERGALARYKKDGTKIVSNWRKKKDGP